MTQSIIFDSVNYTPAREGRGWIFDTADLFLIEGETEYHWQNLPQEQQVWEPDIKSQEWPSTEEIEKD